jgi:hypothetical protein
MTSFGEVIWNSVSKGLKMSFKLDMVAHAYNPTIQEGRMIVSSRSA